MIAKKRKFSALSADDTSRPLRPRTFVRQNHRGWEKLPKDIQIHILGFQKADDAIRLRPTSMIFATSGIEQLRSPNAAACMIAQKHSLRFIFVKELHLHRQVPIFNGACFPSLEILELHEWYTSEVVTGEWTSLKEVNCYGSGDRSSENKWDFFSPDFKCPQCSRCKMTSAYDINLPGRGFPVLRRLALERCASFTLADVSPEEIDPDGFDDEFFNDWHVPEHAWDRVGVWPSVELIRVTRPGYGIALACVFPELTVVEVEQSTGEPVLLAGKFPKLREIRVEREGDVVLTGQFSTEQPPKLIIRFPTLPVPAPVPAAENLDEDGGGPHPPNNPPPPVPAHDAPALVPEVLNVPAPNPPAAVAEASPPPLDAEEPPPTLNHERLPTSQGIIGQ